jgi:hypothetical protein
MMINQFKKKRTKRKINHERDTKPRKKVFTYNELMEEKKGAIIINSPVRCEFIFDK